MQRISDHGVLNAKCDINIILFPSFLMYHRRRSKISKIQNMENDTHELRTAVVVAIKKNL